MHLEDNVGEVIKLGDLVEDDVLVRLENLRRKAALTRRLAL